MKQIIKTAKTFVLIFSCFFGVNGLAQISVPEPSQEPAAPYRLFRTQNIWTFVRLNTITGKMWQVQFDVEGDGRFYVVLQEENLAGSKKSIPGRFTLYPTGNIYTFILLDQIDGEMWQVQWSHEAENRGVMRIPPL